MIEFTYNDQPPWPTLPDTWQAARLFVAPGQYAISVSAIGGQHLEVGTYELEPGETMILLAGVLLMLVFPIPLRRRKGGDEIDRLVPSGFSNFIEVICEYLRAEMARPTAPKRSPSSG